ncbi:MAG: Tc toxin subunit A [Bacteroidia bacterium]
MELLRNLQRLQRISPTPEVAEALHGLGYTSAHQIATGRESQFLLKAAPALQDLVPGKSGRQVAHAVYQAAQAVRSKTWSLALAAQSTSNGSVISAISAKQQQPDFSQGMPTYERLFGPMIGCDCEDCQSIWGPGAYFVDLMNVVQEYITEPSSDTLQPEFALQMRRPDLWDLLIDCANANTEVGYLEIVNGVLRRNLSTNYLDGNDAVEYLASAGYPMDAPYNLPLEETRLALEQSGTSLAAIYRALHLPAPAEAEAILNLSPEQSSIVTGQNLPSLATLYGFRDADAAVWEALTWQPLFLQRTGMTPKELEEMVYQDLRRQSENVVAFFSDMNAATAGSVSTSTLSGDQTVEFWFYGPEAFAVDGITPISMYTGSGMYTDITFQVVINGSGNIFYYFGPGDPNGTPGDGGDFHLGMGVSILPNQWYHIAFTRDIASQTATGYLNGLQRAKSSRPDGSHPRPPLAPITMGQSYRSRAVRLHQRNACVECGALAIGDPGSDVAAA